MKILRILILPIFIIIIFTPAIIKGVKIIKLSIEIQGKEKILHDLKELNNGSEKSDSTQLSDSCQTEKTFYWREDEEMHEINFSIIKEGRDRGGDFWLFFDCKGNLIIKYYSNEGRNTGRRI